MTELKYGYSELDKTHCYYLLSATNVFDSWIWFSLGKNLKATGKDFRLYPFHPNWKTVKTIFVTKINLASKQGEMIARKINTHYLQKSKSK